MTRRTLVACGALAASGCNRILTPRQTERVSIVKAADYSVDLVPLIRRVLDDHRVDVKGKRVVLKPNLVEFSSNAPVNTNAIFVAAVAEAFHARGAREVRIAEGPGHRRTTFELAEAAGFFQAIPSFENHFTDLNLDDVTRISLRAPFSRLSTLYLPHTVLGADLLVSLPKMKTHHWAGATLSMKNLFGVVPGAVYGWPKNILHWAGIDESIADLHAALPRQFCIVDGIVGMQGNGPILGQPRAAGVIVAGRDPWSVDATCCRIMGIDPERVRYLQLVARRRGRPPDVQQLSETIQSVATPFDLIPEHEGFRLNAEART